MKSPASRALALFFLVFLFVPALTAQSQTQFIEVLTVTVKSGSAPEYEAYVKRIVAGADRIGAAGPATVHAFQAGRGGTPNTYFFVFPFNKSEELDGFVPVPQILSRAYGDAEAGRIMRSGTTAVEHFESTVYRLLEGLSTNPRPFDPSSASHVLLVRTVVEPAMSAEYERFLARLKSAQEQASDPFVTVRRVSILGPSHVYLAASFFSKFAELDRRPAPAAVLRSVYGEAEGRALSEQSLRAVRKREVMVLNFRPDLSRLPASGAPR